MYYDSEFQQALPFFLTFIIFYGALLILALIGYILNGVGIMRASAALGQRNGWLGFIPYAKEYKLGNLSGEIELGNRRVRNPGLWLVLLPVISSAIFFVIYFGMIFSMIVNLSEASFYAYGYEEEAVFSAISGFTGGFIALILLMSACSIINSIIQGMSLHRTFSYFYEGQRPVYYALLSLFVPLARGILLMRAGNSAVINPPPYWQNGYYPDMNAPYSQYNAGYPPYPQGGYAGYPPHPQGENPPYAQGGYPPYPQGENPQYPQPGYQSYPQESAPTYPQEGNAPAEYPTYPQQDAPPPEVPSAPEPQIHNQENTGAPEDEGNQNQHPDGEV